MIFRYAAIGHAPNGIHADLELSIEHIGGAMGRGHSLWKHKYAKALISIQSMIANAPPSPQKPIVFLDALKRWTESSYDALKPQLSGSYAGYAYPTIKDWVEMYYGRTMYNRLIDIKRRFPGTEIFNGPQRIQTSAASPENRLSNEGQSLKRSELKSRRSDLCPDWMLRTTVVDDPKRIGNQLKNASLDEDVWIDDIRDKNVVLTGGSRGIGYGAVLHLLQLGARVYATARSIETCRKTAERISKLLPEASKNFYCFDAVFDDFSSVEDLVTSLTAEMKQASSKIDVLILNAAHNGSAGWAKDMVDISQSVAVNHLGQFYLTLLSIQEGLLNLQSGRIIIQSSAIAFKVKEADLIDLAVQRRGDDHDANGQVRVEKTAETAMDRSPFVRTYAATKAMNVAFALELARRLRSTKTHEHLRVFLTLPAVTVETRLSRPFLNDPEIRSEAEKKGLVVSSQAEGALSCVYAASIHLDFLDYPPLTRFVAEEDFAHSTKEELLGIEKPERRLEWEYQKQPAIANYVEGCQVGAIAARFRNLNWMRTNTTCNLWNWSVEILNSASGGQLITKPDQSPLGDLYVANCQLL